MARRILIVDDAPMMRCMMKDLLEEAGYEIVAEIGTGEEAVQRYPELKPDLVTMDLAMPDMDGIAAIQAIVKIDPKATVIVCSSMGWSSSITAAIKAGAKEFFIKPVPPDRFLATVKALLDKKISQA